MSTSRPAARPWRPSGLVTLLTDYGLEDPYAGIVRGVLYRESSALRAVVDLTHAIPPGDAEAAAFLLERSWWQFPAGTVHLAIVDPAVGSARALLMVEARGHVLIAPDSGLLAPVIEGERGALARQVDERAPAAGASHTFHGRDRFAPLAARLVDGEPPGSFGRPTSEYRRLELPRAERGADGGLEARVLHVDRFGNLITNAASDVLADGGGEDWRARWECCAAGRRLPLVRTYADAAPGAAVALVDSYERLEIAVREGSAARELGLGVGSAVRFEPRTRGGR